MTDAFREVAIAAARRAGDLLRAHRGAARSVSAKSSPINLVTEIDRQAEALVVETLHARFPDHSVLGEEGGAQMRSATHRWIIDPLDGTTNFVHGLPLFSVSIALEIEGRVAVGVVYDPSLDECFVAERGAGAFLGDRRLAVSTTDRLGASLLATGFPYDVRETTRQQPRRIRRLHAARTGACASWARPRSRSPRWRRDASTATGSSSWDRGTWPPASCSWRRRAAASPTSRVDRSTSRLRPSSPPTAASMRRCWRPSRACGAG